MQDRGTMLAMPGTIQNQSGWYEFVKADGTPKVMHWRIEEGAWHVVAGPFDRRNYAAAKEEQAVAATSIQSKLRQQAAKRKVEVTAEEKKKSDTTNTDTAETKATEKATVEAEVDEETGQHSAQGEVKNLKPEVLRQNELESAFDPALAGLVEGGGEKVANAAAARRRMDALVKMQAYGRRIAVRSMQVKLLAVKGIMAAMPGTIQNKSGWYEYYKDDKALVVHWRVDEQGAWHLLSGPIEKRLWTEWQQQEADAAVVIQSKLRQRVGAQGAKTKRGEIAFLGIVAKMQAMVRARLARVRVVKIVSAKGGCSAMPGTVQGNNGFYEYLVGTETQIAHFGVTDSGGWELLEGPWTRVEWAHRRDVDGGKAGSGVAEADGTAESTAVADGSTTVVGLGPGPS
jgi:hypothetical protein